LDKEEIAKEISKGTDIIPEQVMAEAKAQADALVKKKDELSTRITKIFEELEVTPFQAVLFLDAYIKSLLEALAMGEPRDGKQEIPR
jgi:hypothetical protein